MVAGVSLAVWTGRGGVIDTRFADKGFYTFVPNVQSHKIANNLIRDSSQKEGLLISFCPVLVTNDVDFIYVDLAWKKLHLPRFRRSS